MNWIDLFLYAAAALIFVGYRQAMLELEQVNEQTMAELIKARRKLVELRFSFLPNDEIEYTIKEKPEHGITVH